MRLNATAADPAAWRALSVRFCGQTFASGAALRAARPRCEAAEALVREQLGCATGDNGFSRGKV